MSLTGETAVGTIEYGSYSVELGVTDDDGIEWAFRDVDYGGDVSGNSVQNASDHGGWLGSQYLAPRVMSIVISIHTTSKALRDQARLLLHNCVPASALADFTITADDSVQFQARRNGKIVEKRIGQHYVEYSIGLILPDPRLYSTTLKTVELSNAITETGLTFPVTFPITFPANPSAHVASVTNSGSIEAPFTCTIVGPLVSPGIENTTTSQAVMFDSTELDEGDILVLDSLTKRAYLNGAYIPADLDSVWFRLAPGSNSILLLGDPDTDATATFEWRDAYDL